MRTAAARMMGAVEKNFMAAFGFTLFFSSLRFWGDGGGYWMDEMRCKERG